jgi:hypothetical protein
MGDEDKQEQHRCQPDAHQPHDKDVFPEHCPLLRGSAVIAGRIPLDIYRVAALALIYRSVDFGVTRRYPAAWPAPHPAGLIVLRVHDVVVFGQFIWTNQGRVVAVASDL